MERNELERRLREIREPAPSPELQTRLEQGIPDSTRRPETGWGPRRIPMFAKLAATVAMLGGVAWVSVMMLVGPASPPLLAAVLEPIVLATERVGAVHLVVRILGRDGEDFSFVNLKGEMGEVEAWIEWPEMPGDPGRARVAKRDRIRQFDGTETIVYFPGRNEAYRHAASGVNLELFWPAAWVRHIQNLPTPGVEIVSHEESSGRGRLVLRERGADTTPLEPSFLGDFDRETQIEWDLKTNLLLGLKRWVYHDGERRLFSELVSIDYLDTLPLATFKLELPSDVRWGGVKAASIELLDQGPREVADGLFEAARRGDREMVVMLCPSPALVDWLLAEDNQPTEILYIGEPFRAGEYAGVYVPYKIRFGSEVKEHNLALRNDNADNRWVIDGGI
jgi:hypothetical protein